MDRLDFAFSIEAHDGENPTGFHSIVEMKTLRILVLADGQTRNVAYFFSVHEEQRVTSVEAHGV